VPVLCTKELNNLVGTIPTEMGLLTELELWGMERGGLEGTIPTEIVNLSKLNFLDLDFNLLTGSLTTQLLSLLTLGQLDLNNNFLTGSIDGLVVLTNLNFLQVHANDFTGTVPEAFGAFSELTAFTLHETDISGVMPTSVCDLLQPAGKLGSLIADCLGDNPDIECDCCTDCRDS
jgi:Leucine-rich repeat (LRR) protein